MDCLKHHVLCLSFCFYSLFTALYCFYSSYPLLSAYHAIPFLFSGPLVYKSEMDLSYFSFTRLCSSCWDRERYVSHSACKACDELFTAR